MRRNWKIFNEPSWFTNSMFLNFCRSFMMYTQPLRTIVYAAIMSSFCALRASYILRSSFDRIVSAIGFYLSFMICIFYASDQMFTLRTASKTPGPFSEVTILFFDTVIFIVLVVPDDVLQHRVEGMLDKDIYEFSYVYTT